MKRLEVREADLPLDVVLVGNRGQQKVYRLERARRVFGLFLNAIKERLSGSRPGRTGSK